MTSVSTIIDAISVILIAFVAISLVVSSIMIGIITYISVLERTKEIGILRAMGASKRDISRVFNAETLIVGFAAGAIGIGVTLLLLIPANAIVYNLTGIDVYKRQAMERVQIGRKTTKGRGAGGKPPVAAESAKENSDDIEEALNGASLVFVAAGMGGGTGTGAAPVIAEIAKKKGILTVGVVTKPFEFEREYKMNLALQGIARCV